MINLTLYRDLTTVAMALTDAHHPSVDDSRDFSATEKHAEEAFRRAAATLRLVATLYGLGTYDDAIASAWLHAANRLLERGVLDPAPSSGQHA